MSSYSNRSILGSLSVILLSASSAALFYISSYVKTDDPSYTNLIVAAISSFNISIFFSWLAMGSIGGALVLFLSVAIVIWQDLKIGLYGYSAFTMEFMITTLIGYAFLRQRNRVEADSALKIERLEEDMNILSNDIKEKNLGVHSLEEKLNRYAMLKGVIESLSTHLSLDDINNLVIEESVKTLGKSGRALLFLVDTEKQDLMLSASSGASRIKTKKGDTFDHWVLRHRKSLIVEDITRDFRFPVDDVEESKKIFKSLIATPLISENKVIGIMRMDNPDVFMFTQDDLRLLDIISDLAAVVIQNALFYSRTQELAIKDGLTGLVVRRYFLDRLEEEIKRAAHRKGAISILMMDIDHFKEYNDKFGHTSGDLVLKYLARTLMSMVKEGDIVARYGGEELVILLCGRNKKEAAIEAEEMRRTIQDKPLTLRRHAATITVSIGVANSPEDAILPEELIKIADERLYKAKTKGRNRTCSV